MAHGRTLMEVMYSQSTISDQSQQLSDLCVVVHMWSITLGT